MDQRELILEQPQSVQIVLKVFMTKDSLDNPGYTFEDLAARAMLRWEDELLPFRALDPEMTAEAVADKLIAKLRQREPWGRIISQDAESIGLGAA